MSFSAKGRRCVLAEMSDDYLPAHTEYLNDTEVNRLINSKPPFTLFQQQRWIARIRKANGQIFAILTKDISTQDGEMIFVGVTELRSIDLNRRTAYSASMIGNKNYWRRGIAREAKLLHLRIAFEEMQLRAVFSNTISPNIASKRLLESTGYHLINTVPKSREVDGVYHDELLYCVSYMGWLRIWETYCRKK